MSIVGTVLAAAALPALLGGKCQMKGKQRKKTGRPKWIPTADQIEQIHNLAGQGLNLEQIAYCSGVAYTTLNERAKEFPEIPEAIKKGRASAISEVSNVVFQGAKKGDRAFAIFFLKAVGGFKDKVEHSTPEGQPFELRHHGKVKLEAGKNILEILDRNRPKR